MKLIDAEPLADELKEIAGITEDPDAKKIFEMFAEIVMNRPEINPDDLANHG